MNSTFSNLVTSPKVAWMGIGAADGDDCDNESETGYNDREGEDWLQQLSLALTFKPDATSGYEVSMTIDSTIDKLVWL